MLQDAGEIPEPLTLAQNPIYNWNQFNPNSRNVQAAVVFSSKLRHHPCLPGVSPSDLARLDRAIADRLPVIRVGEGVKIKSPSRQKSFWSKGKSTPILDPDIAGAAASNVLQSQPTILILWETEACRNALIAELCRVLSLSTSQAEIYTGPYGSLRVITQHIGDLGELLDVGDFTVRKHIRQRRRIEQLEARIRLIAAFVPQLEGLKGALVEIVRSPLTLKPPRVPESDPKLAWRVGLAQAGYVNQHIYALTSGADVDTDDNENLSRAAKEEKERRKQAVSDLLRQWGILPSPLIKPEIDGVESAIWLTCLSFLRRNRRTTVQGVPHTAAIVVRVNALTGEVQATTPMLKREQGWVSYPEALRHLVFERWEPQLWFEDSDEESRSEEALLNQFIAQCLQDCLNTPIGTMKHPRILFMAEAQNSRQKLKWLQNPHLSSDRFLQAIAISIKTTEAQDRIWFVRLRVADDIEVPTCIAKNSEGSRANGVFQWQNVCDDPERSLYLSIGKLPNTAKYVLRRSDSRLDSAKKPAGKTRSLEIAVVHHPGILANQLAYFIYSLRERWVYFADTVSLPVPFPFATKAKEYAVSARDSVETLQSQDFEE